MTTESKLYKGDVGRDLYFDCVMTITGATVTNLLVKKPSGATATWTGTIYGTHHIKFTTVAGSLDEAGTYKVQPYIEKGGIKARAETADVEVYDWYE